MTLTYEFWDQNQLPAMNQIVSAFEQSHPSIRVKLVLTAWPQYWNRLQEGATGGSLSDVFWMNGPHFYLYASDGILMPLGDRIKRDHVDLSSYPKSLVKLYTYKTQVYALPKDYDTIGLWYNKALFRAAHVSFPTNKWTWKDLQSAARRLTNPSKRLYGIAAPATSQEGYYNTIFEAGGYVISGNHRRSGYADPKTIAGLQFWYSFVKNHWSPPQSQMSAYFKDDWFVTGKVAMVAGGSWNAREFATNSYLKDKVGVVMMPRGATQWRTVIHGLGYAIARKTSHPNQAWQFAEFLGSKTAALIEARTGTVIPAYKGTQQPWVNAFPKLHLQNLIQETKYSKPFPISQRAPDWEALEDYYFPLAWKGQMTVADAARTVAREMNAILATEH